MEHLLLVAVRASTTNRERDATRATGTSTIC